MRYNYLTKSAPGLCPVRGNYCTDHNCSMDPAAIWCAVAGQMALGAAAECDRLAAQQDDPWWQATWVRRRLAARDQAELRAAAHRLRILYYDRT